MATAELRRISADKGECNLKNIWIHADIIQKIVVCAIEGGYTATVGYHHASNVNSKGSNVKDTDLDFVGLMPLLSGGASRASANPK